jgi:HlyD family secretion protein
MYRNKKVLGILAVVVAVAGLWYVFGTGSANPAAGSPAAMGNPSAGGGRGGSNMRPTMTVELGKASRTTVSEAITVVGSLIGAATVEIVPKVSGRLESVDVRLGDRVTKGQLLGKLEDNEIREQFRQAEASFEVAKASVRQREADLKFAENTLERTKNLFDRNLLARQALEDAQARVEASAAQLDLVRAQFSQAQARRDELQINLTNTRIVSPVNGFVGSRRLDAGAFVGPNSPLASVVDIQMVRIVSNLVERDLGRVRTGMNAVVSVDAYPGESFKGRVARIAPVLDPATRTAQMEVEIPNDAYRLKPGMYARVTFTVREHPNALVVPRNALIDVEGVRGVFVATDKVATFTPVETGIIDQEFAEVLSGIAEGTSIVTTGAGALRDGDPIQLVGQPAGRAGGPGGNRGAGAAAGPRSGGSGTPAGGAPRQ